MKARMVFNPLVEAACNKILKHRNANNGDQDFVSGVVSFGKRTGFITREQAVQLGKAYKRVVNGGRYVEHDWWH